jgi:hypothetical protein
MDSQDSIDDALRIREFCTVRGMVTLYSPSSLTIQF